MIICPENKTTNIKAERLHHHHLYDGGIIASGSHLMPTYVNLMQFQFDNNLKESEQLKPEQIFSQFYL